MFRRFRFSLTILAACATLAAGPARADWLKAESEHFVVYSQGSERQLRDYVQRLETFDRLLRLKFNRVENEHIVRKLPIYLVDGRRGIERVLVSAGPYVAGVYLPVGEDIFAIAMRERSKDDYLFHEYVHHFMLENFPTAYPAWSVEGFAEYYMTADINDDDVVVGQYNENRAYWLVNGTWVPLEELLSKRASEVGAARHRETYYPVAWLLTHWFLSDTERQAQLDAYLKLVSEGADPVESMRTATGMELPEITRALRSCTRGRLAGRRYAFTFPQANISVTRMPDWADDLLLLGQRLKVGVPEDLRAATAAEVRRLAARHPDVTEVELILAHAELHFGGDDRRDVAVALLDGILERDPTNVEALQFRAVALMDRAEEEEADNAVSMSRQARAFLARAYQADPENFYTLYLIAKSREPEEAYPNDKDLLTWASAYALAPQWPGTRMGYAAALMAGDQPEKAIALLEPLANAPHDGSGAAAAREMIEAARAGSAPPSLDQIEATASEPSTPAEPTSPEEPAEPPAEQTPAT